VSHSPNLLDSAPALADIQQPPPSRGCRGCLHRVQRKGVRPAGEKGGSFVAIYEY